MSPHTLSLARLILGETETIVQHSALTRERLVKARVTLAEQSKSKLIWNYLPVDVAQAASASLDRVLEACESEWLLYTWD
jgi:hypothetical protein